MIYIRPRFVYVLDMWSDGPLRFMLDSRGEGVRINVPRQTKAHEELQLLYDLGYRGLYRIVQEHDDHHTTTSIILDHTLTDEVASLFLLHVCDASVRRKITG